MSVIPMPADPTAAINKRKKALFYKGAKFDVPFLMILLAI